MFNDRSGQMMLINAFLLAIAVVAITLMLNNVIYSSNIAYEGFMDQSRYDDISYQSIVINEAAYAHSLYPAQGDANYASYMSALQSSLNNLTLLKGRSIELIPQNPGAGYDTATLMDILGRNSQASYYIYTTPMIPGNNSGPAPAGVPPFYISLSSNTSTIYAGGDRATLTVKVTDSNSVSQNCTVDVKLLNGMGNITDINNGASWNVINGSLTLYFKDINNNDSGVAQIRVDYTYPITHETYYSNILNITVIPKNQEMSGENVTHSVQVVPTEQANITITFDFTGFTNGNVVVLNNETYDNTQLFGTAPSYNTLSGQVNFKVSRINDMAPGNVTLWCNVSGIDSLGLPYQKIDAIAIYIQPMSSLHIPYSVTGYNIVDGSGNANVVVAFDFNGFTNCNLNLNTIYPDTNNNTQPKNPSLTAAGNTVSFSAGKKHSGSPADVTFWVEVTGVSNSEVDNNINNMAINNHLYYDRFEQIIVGILPNPPIANFVANPTTGNSPLSVQFTDTTGGDTPTAWQWNFGDGSPFSTVQNPLHTFPANNGSSPVTYTITLTSANLAGSNTCQKIGYITVKPAVPAASFTVLPGIGYSPLTAAFTDTSTGSAPTSWQWNFGDGSGNNTTRNPVHTFPANKGPNNATYTITMTASNAWGSTTYVGYVTVIPLPPIANFTATPTSGNSPLTVQFTNNSAGGIPNTWQWNFGDGTVNSTFQNPLHTFPANNGNSSVTYTITLTASNAAGGTTIQKVGYVIVKPPAPSANFNAVHTTDYTVQFTDTSTGSPTSWQWNFGDGSANSTAQNPLPHTYSKKKGYTVTLTVSNAWGTSTIQMSI